MMLLQPYWREETREEHLTCEHSSEIRTAASQNEPMRWHPWAPNTDDHIAELFLLSQGAKAGQKLSAVCDICKNHRAWFYVFYWLYSGRHVGLSHATKETVLQFSKHKHFFNICNNDYEGSTYTFFQCATGLWPQPPKLLKYWGFASLNIAKELLEFWKTNIATLFKMKHSVIKQG